MKRLSRSLFWIVLFLLIVLGFDQFFLRVPVQQPALAAVRQFYLDFRSRLLQLPSDSGPTSVEAVIDKAEKTPVKRTVPTLPKPKAKDPSYFYADDKGELRFADTLEEVPERFRKEAQRLEQ